MRIGRTAKGRAASSAWLIGVAALLTVVGARLLLIGWASDAVPYWDQWVGESATLLDPYMRGQLDASHLLAAHNEHRILFTRLITLACLEIVGTWNPLAEMIVNAAIPLATFALMLGIARTALPDRGFFWFAVAMTIVSACPFGFENVLWGFQSQFYLVAAFSAAAILLLVRSAPLGAGWWAGYAACVAAFLSMASGAVTPLAAAAMMVLSRWPSGSARDRRALASVGLLVLLTAILVAVTPRRAGEAHGIVTILLAAARSGGWPVKLSILSPAVAHLPCIATAILLLRRRAPRHDPRWCIVAIDLWVLFQAGVIAIGRPGQPVVSRYLDTFLLGVLCNLMAALWLATTDGLGRWRRPATGAWMGLIGLFLVLFLGLRTVPLLHETLVKRAVAHTAVMGFARRGDARPLLDSGAAYSENGSIEAGASPLIRGLLPDEFDAPVALRRSARDRLALDGGLAIGSNALTMIARIAGALAAVLGIALFAMGLARRTQDTALRESIGHPVRPE